LAFPGDECPPSFCGRRILDVNDSDPRDGSKTGWAATVTVTASVLVAVVAFAGDAA
jgi:hypothetical protein